MKKLLTRMIGATLGLALAIGVSVGVANNNSRITKEANADAGDTGTVTISSYATSNSWSAGTKYTSMTMNSYISCSMSSSTYTGTYHATDGWKLYESDSGTFTINASGSASLSYVTIVWKNAKNNGCLKQGSTVFASDTRTSVSGTSLSFTAGHSSGSSSGQVGISSIRVEYTYTPPSKTVSSLTVVDGESHELADGGEVNLNAGGAEQATSSVICTVSYSSGDPDGLVDISSSPSAGFNVSTTDHSTYSFTFSAVGDYDVTIASELDDNYSITVTYHVTGIVIVAYTKVTSLLSLQAGSQFIIAKADATFVLGKYSSGNNCPAAGVSPINTNTIRRTTLPANTAVFTLGGSAGAWTLKDQENKYYYGTSGQNYLKSKAEQVDTWSISISNGIAVIKSNASSRQIMKNKSSAIFSTYSSVQDNVSIYMIDPSVVSTKSDLYYRYDKDGDNDPVLSNVTVKFGGQVSKTLWNSYNGTSNNILGYGVMLSSSASIETAYNTERAKVASVDASFTEVDGKSYTLLNGSSDIKNFYNPISTAPSESGDYYVWCLGKGVTNSDYGLTRNYTAVAYIRTTSNEIIFLAETTKSAAQVAKDLLNADPDDEYNSTYLEGSLAYLASKAA